MPISPDGLIVFNPQELAKLSIQTGLQRAQELQLDKINPARLVEAMRDFHPAGLAVEVSLVASREDHMVVSGLQLHPTPGCLAAIVSLSREQSTRGGSGLKPALATSKSEAAGGSALRFIPTELCRGSFENGSETFVFQVLQAKFQRIHAHG